MPTMALEVRRFRWRMSARETRLLIYLLVLLGVVAWKFVPRPWHPSLTLEGPHHIIYSTATRAQTEQTAQAMELLYNAYSNPLGSLPLFQPRRRHVIGNRGPVIRLGLSHHDDMIQQIIRI